MFFGKKEQSKAENPPAAAPPGPEAVPPPQPEKRYDALDLDEFRQRVAGLGADALGAPEFNYATPTEISVRFKKSPYLDADYVKAVRLFVETYDFSPMASIKVVRGVGADRYACTESEMLDKSGKRKVSFSVDKVFNDSTDLTFRIEGFARPVDVEFIRKLGESLGGEKLGVEDEIPTYGAEVVKEGLPWDALAGYGDVKEEILKTVILPFRRPEVYESLVRQTREKPKDIRPRAVLFYGPPGTGKTTMGKIIAKEMSTPFIYVPVESIFTCWYGESPRRLRRIFELASSKYGDSGCVLFIDEIDALASKRSGDMHEESRKVLSVLLTQLDGMKTKPGILTIGTTNVPEDLDGALRRRFDEEVYFRMPSVEDRAGIIKTYAKHLSEGNVGLLADVANGLSGSHIETGIRAVERSWAKRMIESGQDGLPGIKEYLDAFRKISASLEPEEEA
jgi:MoxR-like ATPase